MPRYLVLERSYINNAIREEGDIVEYDGEVAGNLELIPDDPAPKGKGKAGADSADGLL